MLWTNTKRITRSGFYNFWRNGTVSLASVLVMMVTLFVLGFLIFGSAILNTSLAELRNKVDVNVTIIGTADEGSILELKHSLESLPSVSMVTYVSKEEALDTFKARHANDQSILDALGELRDNPLGATLNVKAKDPSQYQAIADFLQGKNSLSASGLSIIDHVNYNQNKTAIDKLTKIIDAAHRLGFAITLAFVAISVLIAFNTIRLTIYIVKDEISVMRLVGASSSYIQGPFVIVGIIYGLVAGFITLLLFLPITYWLGKVTENFFIGMNIFNYYLHQFPQIFIIIIFSGIFIGALSSTLAIRKYLKV
ncbi:MAG: permease-like cell division protein FtsX [Minisyncoccia bacterium]